MPSFADRAILQAFPRIALPSLMPHRITRRDVDQFRVTLFLLDNGNDVPDKLVKRFLELGWLKCDPEHRSRFIVTPEGIRRRHFG